MRVTPASLEAVATFYDMLDTEHRPARPAAVTRCTCARTSPARCAARTRCIDAIRAAAGEDPAFSVRAFECLGACDIAPMASVDGVYVGPLDVADVAQLLDDARAGRAVLPDKQLARKLVADPHANSQPFPEHAPQAPQPLAGASAASAGPGAPPEGTP